MTTQSNPHILQTQVKGRVVTFVVDDVDATIADLALSYELTGKNIPAKVAHRVGEQIKRETGAQRIKVIFTTLKEKAGVILPKFENVNGQLRVAKNS
jgi:hypothetical protein